jgi:hypothetical protein
MILTFLFERCLTADATPRIRAVSPLGNVDRVDLRKLIDNLAADRRRARRQIRIGSIVQEEDIRMSLRVCRRRPTSLHQIRAVLHNFRANAVIFPASLDSDSLAETSLPARPAVSPHYGRAVIACTRATTSLTFRRADSPTKRTARHAA